MKMYRFIFFVGLCNLIIPFLGIPFMYKQYLIIAIAIITLLYALIIRTVQKEKEVSFKEHSQSNEYVSKVSSVQPQKIEDVIEMQESKPHVIVSDVKSIRRPRKTKILINSNMNHD